MAPMQSDQQEPQSNEGKSEQNTAAVATAATAASAATVTTVATAASAASAANECSRNNERPKVDMFAAAREAQQRDEVAWGGSRGGSIKLLAPAKVNLFLGIGARRDDGYHEAETVLHALNLHDVLHMKRMPGVEGEDGLSVRVSMIPCEGLEVPDLPSEQNIAHRAIMRLAQRIGYDQHETIDVRIEKHIPAQGGLGGGSSDAAAALLGAAHFWGLTSDDPEIEEIAHGLGSDVAFFLRGGCARFSGTGEVFEKKLAPFKENVVLVKPDAGISTAVAYRTFDAHPQPIAEDAARVMRDAEHAADVPLFNNLAPASEEMLPLLADVRAWLAEQPGVKGTLLCGSGATTFAQCESFDAACRLSAAARNQGWWARATAFGSLRAALVSGR